MQIDVSLDVYKALTALLEREDQTYNDVIKVLLARRGEAVSAPIRFLDDVMTALQPDAAFASRDLILPNGTSLRAIYKGIPYIAGIQGGRWKNMDGSEHSSPSAAAAAITGTNVNGLRFWEARLPGDTTWRRLDTLVRS